MLPWWKLFHKHILRKLIPLVLCARAAERDRARGGEWGRKHSQHQQMRLRSTLQLQIRMLVLRRGSERSLGPGCGVHGITAGVSCLLSVLLLEPTCSCRGLRSPCCCCWSCCCWGWGSGSAAAQVSQVTSTSVSCAAWTSSSSVDHLQWIQDAAQVQFRSWSLNLLNSALLSALFLTGGGPPLYISHHPCNKQVPSDVRNADLIIFLHKSCKLFDFMWNYKMNSKSCWVWNELVCNSALGQTWTEQILVSYLLEPV